jgi:hypothetical protein
VIVRRGTQLGRVPFARERCSGTFAGAANFIAIELQEIPYPETISFEAFSSCR